MKSHRDTEDTEEVESMKSHRDTEEVEKQLNLLSHEIIGAAIEVHKYLGPGLLESIYEAALCYEFTLRGIEFKRQFVVPIFNNSVVSVSLWLKMWQKKINTGVIN